MRFFKDFKALQADRLRRRGHRAGDDPHGGRLSLPSLRLLFLLSFLYFLFPKSIEPQTSAVTALAPAELWSGGFSQLRGIAVDDDGLVYVADRQAGNVTRIEADRTKTIVAQGLQHPVGLSFDPNGNLLISEETAGRIARLEEDGTLTPLVQRIKRPRWLAVGKDGTLYFSAHDVIQGTDPEPNDETIEPEKILSFSPTGQLAIFAENFQSLQGVAVLDNTLYAGTKGLTSDSVPKGVIFQIPILPDGSAGVSSQFGPADSLKKPVGLAFDRLGALFATTKDLSIEKDKSKQAVAKLFTDGSVISFASNLDDPRGAAFDRQGNLYLADGDSGNLLRFRAPSPPAINAPAFINRNPLTITDTTDPNSRIDAFLNDSDTPIAILTSDGNFSLTLTLDLNIQNTLSVFATAQGGAGLTSAPAEFTIVHDAVAPLILNVTPVSGSFTNNPSPLVSAGFSDSGSGVDPDSVRILLNGSDITSQAQVTASGFTLTSGNPLAQGLYLLTITVADLTGNPASVASNFTVDLSPPVIANFIPADGSNITSARPVISAQFSDIVSGIDPASVQILLDGQNLTSHAAVTTAGFTLDLANLFDLATGAHAISVTVSDRANNSATASSAFTRSTPLQVAITSPADGASVNSGLLLVSGTVDAQGAEVGVSVNGFPAAVNGNQWVVEVPLEPGSQNISAVAVTIGGAQARNAVTVNAAQVTAPFLLRALPVSGVAPLTVSWEVTSQTGSPPIRFEFDEAGTGTFGPPTTNFTGVQTTYTEPGLFFPTLRATDGQGTVYITVTVVNVDDPRTVTARFQGLWSGFKERLEAGDIQGALARLAPTLQTRLEAVFQQIAPDLAVIAAGMGDLEVVEQIEDLAETAIVQQENGVPMLYFIYFRRDSLGRWLIEEM